MWIYLGTGITLSMIIWFDGRPLWRQKQTRTFWVFMFLLSIGAGLLVFQNMGHVIPTPLHVIKWILEPLTKNFYKIFE